MIEGTTSESGLLIPEPHMNGPGHLKQSGFSRVLRGGRGLSPTSPSPAAVADPQRGNVTGAPAVGVE